MRLTDFGQNSRLLLRSYFIIVLGLLVVAFLLDLMFGRFQNETEAAREGSWVEGTISHLESLLADTPTSARSHATKR